MSAEGQDLVKSLLSLNKNVYQPVPAPEFIPVDFGEASRIQHQINVALTALCNCEICVTFFDTFPETQSIAFERTLPQLQEMIELGGMKIKKVHATRLVILFFSFRSVFEFFFAGDGPLSPKLFQPEICESSCLAAVFVPISHCIHICGTHKLYNRFSIKKFVTQCGKIDRQNHKEHVVAYATDFLAYLPHFHRNSVFCDMSSTYITAGWGQKL